MKHGIYKFVLGFVLTALFFPAAGISQFTAYDGQTFRKGEFVFKVTPQNFKLNSKLMGKEMPYRVLLPFQYEDHNLVRYPVIYLLHGLTGHYDNWTEKTKLGEYIVGHKVIIVTPEGDNGWYTDSATTANHKYESYIVQELIPEIDKKFRTVADRKSRAIAGLSMGGYGALKFGMKYPDLFSLAGSFSGALGVTSFIEGSRDAAFIKSLNEIFGPAGSETRKANDIFGLVRALTPEKTNSLPFLYIDCGTEDFLFQNNRDFISLLVEKKIRHEFRQLPGAHNWIYWDSQVQEFLRLADRSLVYK
ncbi:MAG: alpha/beta hydrolase [Blastocatellia bacterium]